MNDLEKSREFLLDHVVTPTQYVHLLLFGCPECSSPVAISRVCDEKNLEGVDAELLRIRCSYCDKSSDVIAATAKRHYVADWS